MNITKPKSTFSFTVIIMLIYYFFYINAWELPLAIKADNTIVIIGSVIINIFCIISLVLLVYMKKSGLIISVIPAIWALFQWIITYFYEGIYFYSSIWWAPLLPIMTGVFILHFIILALKNNNKKIQAYSDKNKKTLKSLPVYIHIVAALLFLQFCQKIVRELIVAFRDFQIRGSVPVIILMIITLTGIILLIFRFRFGVYLSIFCGIILMIQPILYHIILKYPCLGGIQWYPFFTFFQGILIIYTSFELLKNESRLKIEINRTRFINSKKGK